MNSNKILFPILLVVGAILVFYLFIKPAWADVGTLKAERTKYDTALSDAKQLQAKLTALREEMNSFSPDNMTRLSHLLPDHLDNVRFILELNSVAAAHNMLISNIAVAKDARAQGNYEEKPKENSSLHSLDVHFSVAGDYETMLAFLKDLEKSLHMVDIQSVTVLVPKDSNTLLAPYNYSIGISTYWLN